MLRYSKSKKGHNSYKILQNLTKRELDLWFITTKPYTKFQLNTSKHDQKKSRKLFAEEKDKEENDKNKRACRL